MAELSLLWNCIEIKIQSNLCEQPVQKIGCFAYIESGRKPLTRLIKKTYTDFALSDSNPNFV